MYKVEAFEAYTLGEETRWGVEKIALKEKLNIPWGILASAWEETCYRVAEEKFSWRKLRRRG